MKQKTLHSQFILGHLSPLFIGGMIYILFRKSSLIMFSWIDNVEIQQEINSLRNHRLYFQNKMPEWIMFSLPDGFCVFSYMNLMFLLWNNQMNIKNSFWLLIIPIVAILSELEQLITLIPETFYMKDLVMYVIGGSIPFYFIKKQYPIISKYHENKNTTSDLVFNSRWHPLFCIWKQR
ncbi:hypothetical protein FK004_02865 [Flavobacterium kingsejongi]|uniref:Uncharacterized protein n=1 Tax=Flavobacterium kingsejongi TaxID=1678728 RepID=A0A2S1LKH8_9FLAO|nr:hypothetical protein FK004_02865 [Flavobacterium kingsejongi]